MSATAAYNNAHAELYGKPGAYIPADFRERVAALAAAYYPRHVRKLGKPNTDGWAACLCPFHKDQNASASVNLRTGGFRCHGCGAHGDLISVHQRITGLQFKAAVRDLLGLPT